MEAKRLLRNHSEILSMLVRVVDVLGVVLCGFVLHAAYFPGQDMPQNYRIGILLAGLLVAIVFPLCNVYQPWRGRSIIDLVRPLIIAWLVVIVFLLALVFFSKISIKFSRLWAGFWLLTTPLLLICFRIGLYRILAWLRQRGVNRKRIVIVGAGNLGRQVIQRLKDENWVGLDAIAFFDDNPNLQGQKIHDIEVIGKRDQVAEFASSHRVDEIWITLPLRAEESMKQLLHDLRHTTITIRWVPDIFAFRLLNHSMSEIAGMPLLNLTDTPIQGVNRVLKWLEDKLLAGLILILISPVMLMIAIGVKLSSPGPVFFRQERMGWNNHPFTILKFRSMPVDVEKASGPIWAKAGEKRATSFGSFLRRTSLDELPQFINVLKGDMSIVGPRPERPYFVNKFKDEIPDYMKKHLVNAGITGWAQINGWRGNTDLCKRIEYDLYYIENWSLWFDIKIIFLTLFKGFRHRHAY